MGQGGSNEWARPFIVERLSWNDIPLGRIDTPGGALTLTLGFGSGLAVRADGPPGVVWAIGDRGPNLKVAVAIDRYGLTGLASLQAVASARIMPRPDIGPAICQLHIDGDAVRLVKTLPLLDGQDRPISGLPIPSNEMVEIEPAYGLDGAPLGTDASGADTESIVALKDGTFWIGDEYGPSLLKVASDGSVIRRWAPEGLEAAMAGAGYPVEGVMPRIAARRRLNRGFEALAISPDERWLYVAFQSALAHPGEAAHPRGHASRIWKLDAQTGEVVAQFFYRFDSPESFVRDRPGAGWSDLKLCEAVALGLDRLLVLERISRTAKLYVVELSSDRATPSLHLKADTRPTLEQMDATDLKAASVRFLSKRLIFTTDDALEIGPDLEGMAVLSPSELLLVNDNDFGVDGAQTSFWRIRFAAPVFGPADLAFETDTIAAGKPFE